MRGLVEILALWINGELRDGRGRLEPCWWSVVYVIADNLGGEDGYTAMMIAEEWKSSYNIIPCS